jgi:hypothetical protein
MLLERLPEILHMGRMVCNIYRQTPAEDVVAGLDFFKHFIYSSLVPGNSDVLWAVLACYHDTLLQVRSDLFTS